MTAAKKKVKALSDFLLLSLASKPADIAILALLDAAVRILGSHGGLDAPAACKELARIAEDIGRAERPS